MARLQRAAALLCAALVLSAAAVDGAGLWGSSKKDDKAAAKVEPAKSDAVTPQPTAIPAGDGHNLYWCAPRAGAPPPPLRARSAARSLIPAARQRRRYNDVTGETSDTDPLVELSGHKAADSDATYWVDPVTCVCAAAAARGRASASLPAALTPRAQRRLRVGAPRGLRLGRHAVHGPPGPRILLQQRACPRFDCPPGAAARPPLGR